MPATITEAPAKTVRVALKKADSDETEWSVDVAPEVLQESLVMRDMLPENCKCYYGRPIV
jgi:hypothetical protein